MTETTTLPAHRLAGAGVLAGGGAAAAIAAFIAYHYEPGRSSFIPPCVLFSTTGLHCPGCGATRSLNALVHGDVLSSFTYNQVFFVMLLFVGYLAFRVARLVVRPDGRPWYPNITGRGGLAIAGVLVAFFVLRNIPFAPFTFLAPHPWGV